MQDASVKTCFANAQCRIRQSTHHLPLHNALRYSPTASLREGGGPLAVEGAYESLAYCYIQPHALSLGHLRRQFPPGGSHDWKKTEGAVSEARKHSWGVFNLIVDAVNTSLHKKDRLPFGRRNFFAYCLWLTYCTLPLPGSSHTLRSQG